jgi:biopolymer transport protein TolR
MQQGVQVDLPKANAQTLSETPEQLLLVVNKSKQITLNGTPISEGNLRTKLLAVAQNKPDIQIFIQADQTVPYGFIAAVMAEVRQAKISKVGLVTEQAAPGFKL